MKYENLSFDVLRKILINKKVRGFRFKNTSSCNFVTDMECYTNKEAEIIDLSLGEDKNWYCRLAFEDKNTWNYPTKDVFNLFFKDKINLEEIEEITLTKKELFNIILYATQKVNLNKEISLKEISELELYNKNQLFLEEVLKEIKKQ